MTPTSGTLLREARVRSRLSQTELARRAGVAQSVISAYESGRREPSMPTLRKLVAATGHRLAVGLEPLPDARPGLPDTRLGRRLRRRRGPILAAAARHGASQVRVFGSVARGEDLTGSDVDLLVALAPGTSLLSLIALERELESLLGVPVDVVPDDSLKPAVRAVAERESIPL